MKHTFLYTQYSGCKSDFLNMDELFDIVYFFLNPQIQTSK